MVLSSALRVSRFRTFSAHCVELAGIKGLPARHMPQGTGEFAHQGHDDLQLVASTLGLYLFLVPGADNLIVVDQTQGREIEIAPRRPGAPLGDLDLPLVLTAAPSP